MTVGNIVINMTGTGMIVGVIAGLPVAVLWLAALVSVLTSNYSYRNGSQLVWVLAILLAGPVGAILYFVLARESHDAESEQIPDRRRRAEAIADPWSESESRI